MRFAIGLLADSLPSPRCSPHRVAQTIQPEIRHRCRSRPADHRYRRTLRQPEARRSARPARGDREPPGARARSASRRDQGAAGWLHHPHHHRRLHHRPLADPATTYDPYKDLIPVTRIAPRRFCCSRSGQRLGRCRRDREGQGCAGQVTFSSPGTGRSTRWRGMAGLEAGIKLLHVPYRGARAGERPRRRRHALGVTTLTS